MNKTEFVAAVAEKSGLSKDATKKAVDAAFETIIETVAKGQDIAVIGFGTFTSVKKKASEAKNPRTGEIVKVPERTNVKFKVGKSFKDAVNK